MKEKLVSVVTNDKKRTKVQYMGVFTILGSVSVFMSVLNVVTGKGALTWATWIFALLCFLNLLIVVKDKKGGGITAASYLFMVEIIALFVFFIISGNPDGFSAIWIAMLPTCGMLLFGIKKSTVLCVIMLAVLIFFFWLPAGAGLLQYDYNKTFMMRFPILYVAFFVMSALLETIRLLTQRELDGLREEYKHLSAHDHLTGLLNRQGLNEFIKSEKTDENQRAFMLDIDWFKAVNDAHGHDAGDAVLEFVAKTLSEEAQGAHVCRWGGEEFVAWFPKGGGDAEKIRRRFEESLIPLPDEDKPINVTVSIGVAQGAGDTYDLINRADEALYKAKQSGRNRVVSE
ncbi:MAG: diguanylate cyclase [Clostridia bacterium]|nr:diguanylate cyclase [Clostridia bacterium]